jgi:hypothetical protein
MAVSCIPPTIIVTRSTGGRWDRSVYYSVQGITQGGRGDTENSFNIRKKQGENGNSHERKVS